MRGLGYLKDPDDQRDAPLSIAIGASPPPASASVRHPLVNARDQGDTQSCTGQAWSQALRLAWLRKGKDPGELSALDNYWKGRARDGIQRADEGSYLRNGAWAAIKFGCATEKAWPFRVWVVNRRPSWAADRSGHDSRGARGYYRCFGPVDVRRAIASGFPVVGGWEVDRRFVNYDGGIIDGTDTAEVVGGHAVVVESYDRDSTFQILNSWGTGWGESGRAWVSEAWIAGGRDLWAVSV